MATVHGPRHLTAVNYGTRRMVLRSVARQTIASEECLIAASKLVGSS